MVKAKLLKQLRKKTEKADKDADLLDCIADKELLSLSIHSETEDGTTSHDVSQPTQITIAAVSLPQELPNHVKEQVLELFELNMGDMYRKSSWGLDMEAKRAEFEHRKARYLLVRRRTSELSNDDFRDELLAFAHFRFEMDDEESPECAVQYVYEIQVASTFRRQSLGRRLMALLEQIAKAHEMEKVMLTVFKSNASAMEFYKQKLGYVVDHNSPNHEDYEILSKTL